MNWGKSNQLTLSWYKIFEADLGSCIWVTTLVFRILWMLGIGCPSKTLKRRSCDCCLFLAAWHLRVTAHPRHVQVALRSQSPEAAVPTCKRQKREACCAIAGQMYDFPEIMENAILYEDLMGLIPFTTQSLAPVPRAGHRVRVLAIFLPLLLNQPWVNKSASSLLLHCPTKQMVTVHFPWHWETEGILSCLSRTKTQIKKKNSL